MVSTGLKDVGYDHINIDDGFFGGRNTSTGELIIHPTRFPNGLKVVADYIHSKGLKAGIYSDAGANTCGNMYNGDELSVNVGLYNYDQHDADFYFTDCGFDFIKVDFCGGDASQNTQNLALDPQERYTAISQAIAATGRTDVRLNVCRWDYPGTWVHDVAFSWRTTHDIYDGWASVKGIINENLYLSAYCYGGHYNDMDMLEVGRSMTAEEDKTHFGMWCIMSSPLLIGCDMTSINATTLALLKNEELIALNQDSLHLQAYVCQKQNDCYVMVKDIEQLRGNKRAFAVYNPNDEAKTVTVDFSAMDLAGTIQLRDCFNKVNAGTAEDSMQVTLPAHGTAIYVATAEQRLVRTMYEGETGYIGNYQELLNNQTYPSGIYENASKASGGRAATWLGNSADNYLEWRDVYCPAAGDYTLTFAYISGEDRTMTLSVNGVVTKELTSLNSGSWSDVAKRQVVVTLNEGLNTIRLSNATAWMPNIDYLKVEPFNPASVIGSAQTPPMGWNSWDCYASAVTEAQVRQNAEFMRDHLKDLGWDNVIIDIRWYTDDTGRWYNQSNPVFTYDQYGRYTPDTGRFPSAADGRGFKTFGDELHAMGLKWGIHIMRGVPKVAVQNKCPILGTSYTCDQIYKTDTLCTWLSDNYSIDCTKPGAQEYYNSIINMYAEWGIDFLKVDDLSRPYHDGEIWLIRNAIDQCGRDIVFSLSPGATPLEKAADCQEKANMWRMMDDFWDSWSDLYKEFELCANWNQYRQVGHYPDCDMLPLGRLELSNSSYNGNGRWTYFSEDEQKTMMTLWTIFKSPLFFSGDFTYNDDWTNSLIMNRDAIYVDQHSTDNRQISNNKAAVVWAADDPDSQTKYAAVFNISGSSNWLRYNESLYTSETISYLTDGYGVNVEVDVTGCSQLALVVDDSGNGNSYDHGDWINPRVVLSDNTEYELTSADVVRTYTNSYFNVVRWNTNVTNSGNMAVGGTTYAKGFSTDANAMVLFNLPANAVTFKGFGAIDDTGRTQSGSTSSIKFMVFGGDPTTRSACNPTTAIANSGIVSFSSQAAGVNMQADITGAEKLYLVIADAGDGKDYDHGDWINPRIVDKDGNETLITDLPYSVSVATWGYKINQEVDGNALKVNGTTYTNGIGANSDFIMTVTLPSGTEWKTFKSFVGIDDAVSGRNGATVEFLVYTTDPTSYSLDIPVPLTDIGFGTDQECVITDIWTGEVLGSFTNSNFVPNIPEHACGYYKIAPGHVEMSSDTDVTADYLVNPSFENDNRSGVFPTGWTTNYTLTETNVYTAAEKYFSAGSWGGTVGSAGVPADGTYVYQSWSSAWWTATTGDVYQPVTLPAGTYTLSAILECGGNECNFKLGAFSDSALTTAVGITTGSITQNRTGVIYTATFTLDQQQTVYLGVTASKTGAAPGDFSIFADNFRLIKKGETTVDYYSDINKDGAIDAADVVALVKILLDKDEDNCDLDAADVDKNGYHTISDVTTLVNFLMGR